MTHNNIIVLEYNLKLEKQNINNRCVISFVDAVLVIFLTVYLCIFLFLNFVFYYTFSDLLSFELNNNELFFYIII